MADDLRVATDLVQTLEDGKNGFAKAADKLEGDGTPQVATVFRRLSEQRAQFSDELRRLAVANGEDIDQSGTVAAAVHRGWMTIKDAVTGDDPHAVFDVAEQGEDHAMKEFEKALAADISPALRDVVQRQYVDVRAAHDEVKSLRNATA